jgi:hypothetical protein
MNGGRSLNVILIESDDDDDDESLLWSTKQEIYVGSISNFSELELRWQRKRNTIFSRVGAQYDIADITSPAQCNLKRKNSSILSWFILIECKWRDSGRLCPFHGRSITRTIPCKIVGESDGINEIDDDADYKFENSNNVPKGVDKQWSILSVNWRIISFTGSRGQ